MDDNAIDETRRTFIGASAAVLGGAAMMGAGLSLSDPASAQVSTGPAVLGFPDTNGVLVQRVAFTGRNTQARIVANLFKPADFDPSRKYAAIVVTHPIGGVKEQTAGLYAMKLAEKGFVTLAYDATFQGESGGEPHLLESPTARVEDISDAIDFLSAHPQVDSNRIGSLGICGGGSYALNAAQFELRIRAVATVSAADIGDLRRNGLANSRTYEERVTLLRDAAAQRTREAHGEPIRLIPTVPETNDFTASTPIMYREGYEYYRTARGQHPNAPARSVQSGLPAQMAFFAFEQLETISPRPILLIAGAKADSLYFSERAYNKASEPKELLIVPGATHIDMYDKPEFVTPAVAKLQGYFSRHLV
jgi:fermentation-respiration switch protein FrsA (DUF1100 family)